ncbi:MAG: superfamily I DNA/RNA helicase [Colwellia sp.]|jgi:superfamily I DNA/RNA helicase
MLNNQQEFVVNSNTSILMSATPGTGKTRVLIAKVIKLIDAGITMITLITFTKAAANEIYERLIKILGVLPQGVIVGTFHSVISKHINQHLEVGLMSNEDQVSLLHQQYNRYFGEHVGFNDFSKYFEKKVSGSLVQTNDEYEQILNNYYSEMNNITAGMIDLISLGQRLIQEGKIPLLPTDWLLVDEFQDTDLEQIKFILSHGLSDIDLLLVGDADQSIYSFRDALGPEAFNVITDNMSIVESSLSVNYRSKEEILTAAQLLIEHNKDNDHLDMYSHKGKGGLTECFVLLNPTEEALLVSKLIKFRNSGDVAIIARSNYRLTELESVLREQGIKFARRSTSSQFNVAELLYMSLLGALTKKNQSGLTSVIEPILKSNANASLVSQQLFRSNFKTISPGADTLLAELSRIYIDIIKCNYTSAINLGLSFALQYFTRMNLEGLYKMEYLAEKLIGMKGTLNQRLFRLEMNTNKEECSVQTMTGHSAKGLEFDTVYLIGFSEGIFPPKDTKTNKLNLEEERRIAYVKYTRAISQLTILSPIQTVKGKKYGGVSRFVEEAGIQVIELMFAEDFQITKNKTNSHYGDAKYV